MLRLKHHSVYGLCLLLLSVPTGMHFAPRWVYKYLAMRVTMALIMDACAAVGGAAAAYEDFENLVMVRWMREVKLIDWRLHTWKLLTPSTKMKP